MAAGQKDVFLQAQIDRDSVCGKEGQSGGTGGCDCLCPEKLGFSPYLSRGHRFSFSSTGIPGGPGVLSSFADVLGLRGKPPRLPVINLPTKTHQSQRS